MESVARIENTRLPKCVPFKELVGGAGSVEGRKNNECCVSGTISDLSGLTPTSGRLQPRARGNCATRRNKGPNVS